MAVCGTRAGKTGSRARETEPGRYCSGIVAIGTELDTLADTIWAIIKPVARTVSPILIIDHTLPIQGNIVNRALRDTIPIVKIAPPW